MKHIFWLLIFPLFLALSLGGSACSSTSGSRARQPHAKKVMFQKAKINAKIRRYKHNKNGCKCTKKH